MHIPLHPKNKKATILPSLGVLSQNFKRPVWDIGGILCQISRQSVNSSGKNVTGKLSMVSLHTLYWGIIICHICVWVGQIMCKGWTQSIRITRNTYSTKAEGRSVQYPFLLKFVNQERSISKAWFSLASDCDLSSIQWSDTNNRKRKSTGTQ